MWSLTSPREGRTSGPKKFRLSTRKDFFNSIGQTRTSRLACRMSVSPPRADIPRPLRHVRFVPTTEVVASIDTSSATKQGERNFETERLRGLQIDLPPWRSRQPM